jgi:hypothetical protein
MKFYPFDFRILLNISHEQCDFFLHSPSEKLSFDTKSIIKNENIVNTTPLLSNIFTNTFQTQMVYTVCVTDCIIGPMCRELSRYWPVLFGDKYAFNFINEKAKEIFVYKQIIQFASKDYMEIDMTNKNCVEFNEPCVWLYTFFNIDHLLRESLPAILTLLETGVDFKTLKFIVPNLNKTEILEILIAIGISPNNIIQIDGQWMKFKKVYIPCFHSFGHLHTPSPYYMKTANMLLDVAKNKLVDVDMPKRIFVSRDRAKMRRLLNEKYFHNDLLFRGFKIIDPGVLTKLEQAIFFSNAEIIIGQHGMGIANAAFAKKNCTIVEIMNTNYNRVSYFRTAQYQDGVHGIYYAKPLDIIYAQNNDIIGDIILDRKDFLEFIDIFI